MAGRFQDGKDLQANVRVTVGLDKGDVRQSNDWFAQHDAGTTPGTDMAWAGQQPQCYLSQEFFLIVANCLVLQVVASLDTRL